VPQPATRNPDDQFLNGGTQLGSVPEPKLLVFADRPNGPVPGLHHPAAAPRIPPVPDTGDTPLGPHLGLASVRTAMDLTCHKVKSSTWRGERLTARRRAR
jgi:hypothetical protein